MGYRELPCQPGNVGECVEVICAHWYDDVRECACVAFGACVHDHGCAHAQARARRREHERGWGQPGTPAAAWARSRALACGACSELGGSVSTRRRTRLQQPLLLALYGGNATRLRQSLWRLPLTASDSTSIIASGATARLHLCSGAVAPRSLCTAIISSWRPRVPRRPARGAARGARPRAAPPERPEERQRQASRPPSHAAGLVVLAGLAQTRPGGCLQAGRARRRQRVHAHPTRTPPASPRSPARPTPSTRTLSSSPTAPRAQPQLAAAPSARGPGGSEFGRWGRLQEGRRGAGSVN